MPIPSQTFLVTLFSSHTFFFSPKAWNIIRLTTGQDKGNIFLPISTQRYLGSYTGWYPSLTFNYQKTRLHSLAETHSPFRVLRKVTPNCLKPAVTSTIPLPLLKASASLSVNCALIGLSGTAVADIPEIAFHYLS